MGRGVGAKCHVNEKTISIFPPFGCNEAASALSGSEQTELLQIHDLAIGSVGRSVCVTPTEFAFLAEDGHEGGGHCVRAWVLITRFTEFKIAK